ncbi:MAG TPA: beta-propeller domain-containing protein, partial [Longimicrobium sp.]|nr:beta-propeller domain-containing protein [Longimicrobium sp.]
MTTRLVLPLAAVLLAAAAAHAQTGPGAGLTPFRSDGDLLRYLGAGHAPPTPPAPAQSPVLGLESVVVASAADGAGRSGAITNNQHAGVDEGAIVKLHGDYLVVLRRGRLFTVDVGGGRLRPVSAVNAFGPDVDPGGTWYDEMLVSGDQVVVIGYSYARGGSEVGVFRIDAQGRLRYRATYNLRSDDYYSSRNYASRLIGTRLVMYAPVPVNRWARLDTWIPAMRRWRPGAEDAGFRRTLSATRIYQPARPLTRGDDAVLHTVTTCELGSQPMECESTAVLGPAGQVFYVSPGAVYVWTTDEPEGDAPAPSAVYRIPLDGSRPQALLTQGSPIDQFSFLESGGWLNVLVGADAYGNGMWNAEGQPGDVRLLRVPLARFGGARAAAPRSAYRALPGP